MVRESLLRTVFVRNLILFPGHGILSNLFCIGPV